MTTAEAPRVVHSLPGRVRVHMPALSGDQVAAVEQRLAEVPGIRRVRASGRTRNVLVDFDASCLDEGRVLRRLQRLAARGRSASPKRGGDGSAAAPRSKPIVTHSSARRARIAVRGLDRDHDLRARLAQRLERRPDVRRAVPSALTGRVLVELAEGTESLQGILEEIADSEPPGDGADEIPAHPLDSAPIIDSGAKFVGAAVGLALVMARRATGAAGPPVAATGPGEVAGAISLVESVPAVSHKAEEALGPQRKALLFGAVGIVAMSASGSTLGLAFAAAGAARHMTEGLARRRAWKEYLERLGDAPAAYPGAVLSLSPGQRAPLSGSVVEGFAIASALDGSPQSLAPGARIDAGARVYGGTVRVKLRAEPRVAESSRPPPPLTTVDRYLRAIPYAALAYAAATLVVSRSPARALTGLLLVNPVGALVGRDFADRSASARVIRAGGTVVGSRPHRAITRPDALLVDGARVLCDGWELREAAPAADEFDEERLRGIAGAVSIAAGSPWGVTLHSAIRVVAADGTFDGRVASAEVDGERWLLEPPNGNVDAALRTEPGDHLLVLRRQRDGFVAGALALQPHLTRGVATLREVCRHRNVDLELVSEVDTPTVRNVADRAGAKLVLSRTRERVREDQEGRRVVAVVADSAHGAPAFEQCDLAIAVTSGLGGRFEARADLLAPRLEVVAAIVYAGARRDSAVRDAVLMSMAGNAGGAAWGLARRPAFKLGARPGQICGLAAMADATARLWGGRRARTVTERLADPVPERWGYESVDDVLRHLGTTPEGLTDEEARARWRAPREARDGSGPFGLVLDQVRSPLVAVLGAGAAVSLALGAVGDVAMIGAVVAANAVVGAWEEGRAGRARDALHEMTAGTARVARGGRELTLTPAELVPGDLALLAAGDRIPADARLISSEALEVDEAALTGESIPVMKSPDNGSAHGRVVLAGTDVTMGTGRAVVVAVGDDTRMGAIAAALAADPDRQSPLDERLSRMLWAGLPWVAAGGLAVTVAGIVWGQPALQQLALGASVAIAAVPEGLPLLAGLAEAAVARRLAEREALVTRLSAVEALGRVDVACVDKTGTLTTGRLAVTVVADAVGEQASPQRLTPALEDVLRAAAVASPSPDALDARAHPTDVAVVEAARAAGVSDGLGDRQGETRFEPARSFHATRANGHVWLKGAVEILVERCTRVRTPDGDVRLDAARRRRLLDRATALATQGLRVLIVAEGGGDESIGEPADLVALGFVGISDPLRPTAREAVRRCTEAGVRLIMLTGDHPATAQAIAREAGLPADDAHVLMGRELGLLDDETLLARLEQATILARTTPLDKLRIVEVLRQGGHVVAMTGDGVNDAPALRLADVGVAMGRGATEVARQAADLVLTDDDFSTLAEALVEGRGFWLNMRRSLGLLLGGNGGEVGLMTAAAIAGLPSPLTTRQVLTVNLVTDVLPAISVAVQPPEHRNLSQLSREGSAALDAPLRADIIRRAIATGASSLGAYLVAARTISPAAGRSTAYLSIVATQLAQTVDIGRSEGRLTSSVAGAVTASLAVLVATVTVPGLRGFLGLTPPTPAVLALTGGASAASVALSRTHERLFA